MLAFLVAFLVALRDALIVLALNWVGVTLKQPPESPAADAHAASVCATDSGACAKPSFDAFDCPNS